MRKTLSLVIILVWLILLFFYWDSNKNCCSDSNATSSVKEETGVMPVAEEPKTMTGPLLFNWGQSPPVTGEGWASLKSSIIADLGAEKILEITGLYRENEPNNSTFENLGIARANEVRKLFTNLPDERIRLIGELVNTEVDSTVLFESCDFDYKINTASIKEIADKTLIYFPFNSNNKLRDQEVENYLDDVAERVTKTGERILLEGHTDNIGSTESNIILGQKRADIIKAYLVSKGVNASNIDAKSIGESQPVSDNSTSAGRAENRRTELQIIK